MMRASLLLVVAAIAAALAATPARPAARVAWPPLASARTFLYDDLQAKLRGRWGEAWATLYPAHRRVASRWAYVRCERATPFAAPLGSLRILAVRRAAVHVAGRPGTVAGVALPTRIVLEWFSGRDPIVVRHTFHLVPVDGRWTWLLSRSRYELYLHDRCGPQVTA